MMKNFNVSLGSWFGIPVWLHWSWFLLIGMVSFSEPYSLPILLSLFAIVVLHEFGHVYAGKKFGIVTEDVTLYFMGGVANMKVPAQPKQEFFIAIAGPLVNLMLSAPFFLLANHLGGFFETLFIVNIAMMVLNLIPAFPLDGGRILRSILCLFFERVLATKIAVRISEVFCVLGVFMAFKTGSFNIGLISFFIFLAAEAELIRIKMEKEPVQQTADQIFRNSQAEFLALERNLRNIRERYE